MGGFAMNISDVKDYEEKLIPAGKYLVEILKGTDGETSKGRGKIDLRAKVLDTIPSGEEIDTDKYLDPIDGNVFPAIFLPQDNDINSTKNMMTKGLSNWVKFFDLVPADDEILTGKDFEGLVGGIVVKHELAFKDDPDSDLRAVVKGACQS